jgi:chromosome segregation ATPase
MKMVADLQAENADLRTAVNKVQRTNTELQSVVESYHSDLESLTGEAQRLVTTVASQDTTIREYQQRIQELEQKAQASASLTDSVEAQVRRATGSLREELRKKDEELTQTFALATDLNKQRGQFAHLLAALY